MRKKGLIIVIGLFLMVSLSAGYSFAADKDTVTIAIAADVTTLNPVKYRSGQEYSYFDCLFQALAVPDTYAGAFVPSLAESMELMDNGKDILIKLEKGHKFHNGDPVTAHDVRFSWQIYKEKAKLLRSFWGPIEDVEVIDDHTCIFRYKAPEAPFVLRKLMWLMILPKKHYEKVGEKEFSKHPVGSGPFRFVERKIGEGFTFEAVQDHPNCPNFKRLKVVVVPDEMSRIAMLKTGEADLIGGIPPHQAKILERDKHIKVKTALVPSFHGIAFGINNNPLMADQNLRLAFMYGIDRQEIVDKLFLGRGHPLYYFASQVNFGFDPNLKYPYDPEKAKELVKKSSYKPGTPLTLTYIAAIPMAAEVMESVQGYMQKVGVQIKLNQMEAGAFVSRLAKKGEGLGHLYALNWHGQMDPSGRFTAGVKKGGFYSPWPSREDLDKLIDEQRVTMDLEKRKVIMRKIYRIVHEDPPAVGLFGLEMIYAMRDRIDYTWCHKIERFRNLCDIKVVK